MEKGQSIAIPEDRKVIFKHVDANNFAILTRPKATENRDQLNLKVINSVTGRVLFSGHQRLVSDQHPINLAFDEHSIITSYFSQESLVYELWIVEIYRDIIENSFLKMVEIYYLNDYTEDMEAFYTERDSGLVTFQQKYAFSFGIQHISIVNTPRKVTRRNLVIITPKNQIYSMDRALTSTRRPVTPDGKPATEVSPTSFESSEIPPYHYILPVVMANFITYNHKLTGLNNVKMSPTGLESTGLLLAYGHDLYYNKIAPDKNYDQLNDDFNYLYLILTVLLVISATLVAKRLAQRSKIYRIFYTSQWIEGCMCLVSQLLNHFIQ
eukprot:TRINITY_DN648_c0_g1_i7.p1 TRINITY_DN648_c0_g1~~TRINITY_DN648_c0_g1_i7.p1  ORF type:complete len:324 (+),score=66.03 TRINITY_DN648_c0_g1_i7:325-1296(+)